MRRVIPLAVLVLALARRACGAGAGHSSGRQPAPRAGDGMTQGADWLEARRARRGRGAGRRAQRAEDSRRARRSPTSAPAPATSRVRLRRARRADRAGVRQRRAAADARTCCARRLSDSRIAERHAGRRARVDDPKLPPASVDLALMVDVYHELSQPQAMLRTLREALKPGGRLVLLEYRKEDPAIPIKPRAQDERRGSEAGTGSRRVHAVEGRRVAAPPAHPDLHRCCSLSRPSYSCSSRSCSRSISRPGLTRARTRHAATGCCSSPSVIFYAKGGGAFTLADAGVDRLQLLDGDRRRSRARGQRRPRARAGCWRSRSP